MTEITKFQTFLGNEYILLLLCSFVLFYWTEILASILYGTIGVLGVTLICKLFNQETNKITRLE